MNEIIDHRTVDEATIADDRRACVALDQARALVPGATTWGIRYAGGQRGQMSRWPDGRGAIATGGDSAWGDWIPVPSADGRGGLVETLALDAGGYYDEYGQVIELPGSTEQ